MNQRIEVSRLRRRPAPRRPISIDEIGQRKAAINAKRDKKGSDYRAGQSIQQDFGIDKSTAYVYDTPSHQKENYEKSFIIPDEEIE